MLQLNAAEGEYSIHAECMDCNFLVFQYFFEMIHHRTNFPGILKAINLLKQQKYLQIHGVLDRKEWSKMHCVIPKNKVNKKTEIILTLDLDIFVHISVCELLSHQQSLAM